MPTECVVFTGHAGINMSSCLDRLAAYAKRTSGSSSQVVKIEGSMIDHHLMRYPEDPDRVVLERPGGFQYLLSQPKKYLSEIWESAARSALSVPPEDPDILLVGLHAVFFNTTSRDFFPAGDYQVLRTVLEERGVSVRSVVTLVDDIYDSWGRLAQPGQLFSDTEGMVQAILDLVLLLNWRATEILVAELLAVALGVPHRVLAIKHPLSVAYDIGFSDKHLLYVAHPISEIRSLTRQGATKVADEAMHEVEMLVRGLLASDRVVPIFPTTIDELRLQQAEEGRGPLPALEDRWPSPVLDSETLVGPADAPFRSPFDFATPEQNDSPVMTGLLEGLRRHILSQVGSRDRKLIEQTAGLVAWRPCFKGHVSGGVSNEINHRNAMIARGEDPDSRRAFVLMRAEDIGLYRAAKAADEIATRAEELDDEERAAIGKRLEALSTPFYEATVDGEQLRVAADPDASVKFLLSTTSRSALGGEEAVVRRREAAEHWREVAENACAESPSFGLQDSDLLSVGDPTTIQEFISMVESRFTVVDPKE